VRLRLLNDAQTRIDILDLPWEAMPPAGIAEDAGRFESTTWSEIKWRMRRPRP
jgi:hypothetical protein